MLHNVPYCINLSCNGFNTTSAFCTTQIANEGAVFAGGFTTTAQRKLTSYFWDSWCMQYFYLFIFFIWCCDIRLSRDDNLPSKFVPLIITMSSGEGHGVWEWQRVKTGKRDLSALDEGFQGAIVVLLVATWALQKSEVEQVEWWESDCTGRGMKLSSCIYFLFYFLHVFKVLCGRPKM